MSRQAVHDNHLSQMRPSVIVLIRREIIVLTRQQVKRSPLVHGLPWVVIWCYVWGVSWKREDPGWPPDNYRAAEEILCGVLRTSNGGGYNSVEPAGLLLTGHHEHHSLTPP